MTRHAADAAKAADLERHRGRMIGIVVEPLDRATVGTWDVIPLEPLPRSPRRGLAFETAPGEITSLRPSAAAAFALTARQT